MNWRTIGLSLICLCVPFAATHVSAETLSVGGTGSAEPIVKLLFEEFRKEFPAATLNHLSPPVGTGGALKGLASGRLDLAVIGRFAQPEEAKRIGRQVDIAETAFVMASRDETRESSFTPDELAQVYQGQLKTWKSGVPIRLILRASFESDTLTLKSMSPAMNQAVSAAALRPGMVTADNDLEALKLLAETPGSLGPSTLGLIKASHTKVHILPINGITPSAANVRNGSYPWRKPLIVALPQQPSPLAERFVDFLLSAKARSVLQRYDYWPNLP